MNEPLGSSHAIWVEACQKVIDKLRNLGSKELILVPGLGYTGAASYVIINKLLIIILL